LFYLFAGVAVVSGTLLVTHHNPVRAALSFVLVVLSVCGLFLLQAAPFLMAATIIVYAGAIVVTFLFVIMLAQQLGQSNADLRTHELVCSSIAGAAMLATLVVVLMQTDSAQGLQSLQTFPTTEATLLVQRTRTAAGMSEPAKIVAALEDDGATLFDDYRRLGEADRGSQAARSLLTYVREHQTEWDDAKKRQLGTDLQRLLGELAEKGSAVVAGHTADGKSMMPAENTAALGVSLFTDYFLAVELAGSLLLIATVGAIAVTARRPDAVAVASPVSNHFAGRAGGQV
jgi:NADH:ubiquinone oxidoreductase subunit 6 (subunit J)